VVHTRIMSGPQFFIRRRHEQQARCHEQKGWKVPEAAPTNLSGAFLGACGSIRGHSALASSIADWLRRSVRRHEPADFDDACDSGDDESITKRRMYRGGNHERLFVVGHSPARKDDTRQNLGQSGCGNQGERSYTYMREGATERWLLRDSNKPSRPPQNHMIPPITLIRRQFQRRLSAEACTRLTYVAYP
jgi:hypothetical protein